MLVYRRPDQIDGRANLDRTGVVGRVGQRHPGAFAGGIARAVWLLPELHSPIRLRVSPGLSVLETRTRLKRRGDATLRRARPRSRRGQPAQSDSEQQAEPSAEDRHADDSHQPGDLVDPAILLQRRDDPERDRDGDGEQEAEHHQLERDREGLPDARADRGAIQQRAAEIALQHAAARCAHGEANGRTSPLS